MQVENVAIELIDPGKRYRKDNGDLEPLKQSIQTVGLLHPIVVTSSWKLIAGGRRLEACRELGHAEIAAQVIDLDNIEQAELDENEIRKDMTASEKLELSNAIIMRKQPNPQLGTRKVKDKVAKKAGFSGRREMERTKSVMDKCSESVKELVDDGTASISDAESIADLDHDLQEKAVANLIYGATKTLKKGAELAQKQSEAAGSGKEEVLDCHGISIPDHLVKVYEEVASFDEALQLCEQLRYRLNQIDKNETSRFRQTGNLQLHLRTIEENMKSTRFWCVCPACLGNTASGCAVCMSRRFFQVHDKGKVSIEKYLKQHRRT